MHYIIKPQVYMLAYWLNILRKIRLSYRKFSRIFARITWQAYNFIFCIWDKGRVDLTNWKFIYLLHYSLIINNWNRFLFYLVLNSSDVPFECKFLKNQSLSIICYFRRWIHRFIDIGVKIGDSFFFTQFTYQFQRSETLVKTHKIFNLSVYTKLGIVHKYKKLKSTNE